jgi:hypothetical protein
MTQVPRRVGDQLAGCATSVLGKAVVGVILHGSTTTALAAVIWRGR